MLTKTERELCNEIIESTIFAYDRDLKVNFLREILKNEITSVNSFKLKALVLSVLSRFEDEVKRPVSRMSKDQVDVLFRSFDVSSTTSIKIYYGVIKSYIVYVHSFEKECDLGFLYLIDFNVAHLKAFINDEVLIEKVITPAMIEELVEKYENIDPSALSLVILLWEGANIEDLTRVKATDVSFNEAKNIVSVKCNGKTYISKYVEVFKKALTKTTYDKYNDEGEIVSTLLISQENKYLFKNNVSGNNYLANELDVIPVQKLKKRLKNFSILANNKMINCTNIEVSKKTYDMVKEFNFVLQKRKVYLEYLQENNIKYATSEINENAKNMIKKVKSEGGTGVR